MGDLAVGPQGPINVPLRTWDRATTSKSFEPIDTFEVKLEVHCRLRERERELMSREWDQVWFDILLVV
jgi:hypothetical protein